MFLMGFCKAALLYKVCECKKPFLALSADKIYRSDSAGNGFCLLKTSARTGASDVFVFAYFETMIFLSVAG